MKAILYSKEGKKKQEIVLNPSIYAARVNHRLLELVKNAFAANLRRGTHATKTRKEVSGGGKKPWKQKGTGRARHSSIRSPIWRGGGTVFGPHPRSYFVNLPKTMKDQALISALSLKGEEKGLLLVEDLKLEQPKTREWVDIFKKLPLDGKRALCVVRKLDDTIRRASQNFLNRVEIEEAHAVNAYHIMNRPKLVIEQEALSVIEGRLAASQATTPEAGSDEAAVKVAKPKVSKTVSKVRKTKKS